LPGDKLGSEQKKQKKTKNDLLLAPSRFLKQKRATHKEKKAQEYVDYYQTSSHTRDGPFDQIPAGGPNGFHLGQKPPWEKPTSRPGRAGRNVSPFGRLDGARQ
jgi:hypothetical protein